MKRYLGLYASFFRASLMADLEYRLNILTKIFTDILWYLAQASVFEVLFHHVPQISGWDIHSARVFMAIVFVVDAIWMILFQENFERLSWKVKQGELDLVLAKPVDAQFFLTLQKQNTSYVINTFLASVYLSWTISQLPQAVAPWKIVLFITVGIPLGLLVSYSFRLMFSTLSVVYTNAESINYVWYQIYRLGMRPDPFYPKWLRILVLTLLPVGFVASVPARLIIGDVEWWLILGGITMTTLLFLLSRYLWKKSLRHYASASS